MNSPLETEFIKYTKLVETNFLVRIEKSKTKQVPIFSLYVFYFVYKNLKYW